MLPLLLAATLYAPTRCQTTTDTVMGEVTVKILLACSDGFADDVLWHLDRIDQIPSALDGRAYRGFGGRGSVIYILDTGVLATHDEFMTATGSRVIAGYDALPSDRFGCKTPDRALQPCASSPPELSIISHGTATASVAAGNSVGVAPEASVVSVRTVAGSPIGMQNLSDGLDAVIRHAFDPIAPQFRTGIVSISFAINEPGSSAAVEEKIRRMVSGVDRDGNPDPNGKRFFFSIAAGNSNQPDWCPNGPTVLFPSTLGPKVRGVMTVGGSSKDNNIWIHSCRGEEIFAPAEDLLVATSSGHNHYRAGNQLPTSGTSWSAPIVAGIAARLLEMDPTLTPEALEDRIEQSASRLATGEVEAVFTAPPGSPRRRAARH